MKRYEDALLDCSEAINLDLKYMAAYNNRGSAYRGLRNYNEAIADYGYAIKLNADYDEAYKNRG